MLRTCCGFRQAVRRVSEEDGDRLEDHHVGEPGRGYDDVRHTTARRRVQTHQSRSRNNTARKTIRTPPSLDFVASMLRLSE